MLELCEALLDDTDTATEASTQSNSASESTPVKYNKQQIKWINVILLTVLHIASVYGILASKWSQISFKTYIWSLAYGYVGGFGVTAGAHRLWTHRAYKAKWPLRVILIVFYSMAGHSPLFHWVRDHRVHHKFSETDADPHNAKRGFFFAHVGWLMMTKHPEVKAKGRQIDMSDLSRDPIVLFHSKYFVVMQLLFSFVIPVLTPYLMWGETGFNSVIAGGIVRYAISLHLAWLVNSAAHIWGNKPFNRGIMASDNRFVSFVAMGEGWHNYHHVFPWDYKAAELGNYSMNLTTFWIDMFALMGWAYDLRAPSRDMVRTFAIQHGNGPHKRPDRTGEEEPCFATRHGDGSHKH